MQIKNVLKQNTVYHTDFRMQSHYLLVVIVVSDVSESNTVIFAVKLTTQLLHEQQITIVSV